MRSRARGLIILLTVILFIPSFKKDKSTNDAVIDHWFPYYDFDAAIFKDPPRSFGPFTRWWWPGNDVTNEELQREIKMFADNGFAGVEIQPLTMGINPDAPKPRLDSIYSWDSPSFFEHLNAVMQQAKISGIAVDLNAGSGWPIGGPQVKPDESMLTLTYADTVLNATGNESFEIKVPNQLPYYGDITIFDTHLYKPIASSYARLQAVYAAKIIKKESGQTFVDGKALINITDKLTNKTLRFALPEKGTWDIIAYWSVPDGQIPTLIASSDPGLVANHFDSLSIIKNYNYLFGARSCLEKYYAQPMRAVFNDSYEFRSDRHYNNDFISFFKTQRGYDITPFLGACLQRGYNNNAGFFLFPNAKAPFVFSEEDWRIQHDYDLTVGELLQQQFIKASDHWMNDRGMLHRTQAYGVKTDVIASSGAADIPEAEQLFAKGSEGFIKLISSGAHLYDKPVTSQESFVFLGRSEMTTAQKIRTLSDKAFTAGINQLVYSGTSYKYMNEDYGKEGWNTWSTPYSGFDFSSNVNESFTYWNDIKRVNEYITRSQYVLRSGKPHADVLVYFPFTDFTQEDLLANPEETFANGYFKGVEAQENEQPKQELSPKERWFKEAWKTINILNAYGITWDWANDASLQKAVSKKGKIIIRENEYEALMIVNAPYMQTVTAEKTLPLSKAGAKIATTGHLPGIQPGFLNYSTNDNKVKSALQVTLKQHGCTMLKDSAQVAKWAQSINQPISFAKLLPFTRTLDRKMQDKSMIKLIWNQSDQWQQVSFVIADTFADIYWLDATNAEITKANKSGNTYTTTLPPYGSVFLYASKTKINATVTAQSYYSYYAKELLQLNVWNIKSGDAIIDSSDLFDWRNDTHFKFQFAPGVYSTSFKLDKESNRHYILDLGKVYFTADIKLNGINIGKSIWSPYESDITNGLRSGENKLEITVVPTNRNAFINEAANGNKLYKQFKGKENALMPAGLVGPVRIMTY